MPQEAWTFQNQQEIELAFSCLCIISVPSVHYCIQEIVWSGKYSVCCLDCAAWVETGCEVAHIVPFGAM